MDGSRTGSTTGSAPRSRTGSTTGSRTDPALADVRRSLLGCLDAAVRTLAGPAPDDEAVHSARKSLKRARALLRLLRPALGARVARRENVVLRDVARGLSSSRDAKVLAAALDDLAEGAGVPRRALETLAARLEGERGAALAGLDAARLEAARRTLQAARRRLATARWRRDGWEALAEGLRRVHARGRRAHRAALATPDAECLHEWRKQVKILWYSLEQLEPVWPRAVRVQVREASRLADALGEDHDLALLLPRLRAATPLEEDVRGALLAALEQRRADLQRRAFERGQRLYGEKPGRLAARLGSWRRARGAEAQPRPRPARGQAS